MVVKQVITKEELNPEDILFIDSIGMYPHTASFNHDEDILYGNTTYVLPKLDGVNLQIINLDNNRYALLTRQGYVEDQFIEQFNKILPQNLFKLAEKYITFIEFESILIPTTSQSLCNYNIIDLRKQEDTTYLPIFERTRICKEFGLNYPTVLDELIITEENSEQTKAHYMNIIKKNNMEGVIFEINNNGTAYKLRYKDPKHESIVAKVEQEYSKLFLETGHKFLEFESINSQINERLTREFGKPQELSFMNDTHRNYCRKILDNSRKLVNFYATNHKNNPISILIGGNNGTGKTTTARALCNLLQVDHRIGTGFVREILRTVDTSTEMTEHTYDLPNILQLEKPYEGLLAQSVLMNNAISSILNRSNDEGTSIILEGNHLTPEIISQNKSTLSLILNVPDVDEHKSRVLGKSHRNRQIDDSTFNIIRNIQQEMLIKAKKHNISRIDNNELSKTLDTITLLLSINLLPRLYQNTNLR